MSLRELMAWQFILGTVSVLAMLLPFEVAWVMAAPATVFYVCGIYLWVASRE